MVVILMKCVYIIMCGIIIIVIILYISLLEHIIYIIIYQWPRIRKMLLDGGHQLELHTYIPYLCR